MPKIATIQTNGTGGELSPALAGRVDVAKYNSGFARLENFYARVQGGVVGRDGSRDLGAAKGDGRLIPFVYSRALAYQLEVGPGYIRVWRMDSTQVLAGSAPLELATPYSAQEVAELNYEQGDDTMFLFHVNHPTQRLQRYSDAVWRIGDTPWINEPASERGEFPAAAATLSAATVGTGRSLAADAATFLESDVGREFSFGLGLGEVTGYTDATHVTVSISAAFESTALPAGAWLLDGSPQALIYATDKGPVGTSVSIYGAVARPGQITLEALTGSFNVNSGDDTFTSADVGKFLYADAGRALITAFIDGSSITVSKTSSADFLASFYDTGAWGITGAVFRASDVGRSIKAKGTDALYRITSVGSPSQVFAQVRNVATSLISSPAGAWEMQSTDWSPGTGYPRTGALYEQRLWVAGSNVEPRTIWASGIAEYLDFEPGLDDSNGFTYALNVHQRNPIIHMAYARRLFALTTGLEISLKGGNEKALGPTNIQKTNETSEGTSQVRPVSVAGEVLYVQGAGRKVHALGYSAAIDGFDSPDRTVFADHITTSGIVDMAFASQPDTLLYAVRADGQIAVCTYNVAQEVIGWSRFVTDGQYRSVSVIPRPTRDDVWALVRRTLGGVVAYRIERFESALKTDCARSAAGGPTSTWNGFQHLAGMTVAVKADGINQGMLAVSGTGQITLPREAKSIEAGLPYVPELEMLPPEFGSGSTAQGSNLSVHEVTVRVLSTESIEINGNLSDFRKFGAALLDKPPPGYTGDFRSFTLTDNVYRPKQVIRQPLPYPCHVLAVIRKCTVNDT